MQKLTRSLPPHQINIISLRVVDWLLIRKVNGIWHVAFILPFISSFIQMLEGGYGYGWLDGWMDGWFPRVFRVVVKYRILPTIALNFLLND